jgi:hypothetical protein
VLSRVASTLANAYGETKALKVLASLKDDNFDALLNLTKKAYQTKKSASYSGPLYMDIQHHITRLAQGSNTDGTLFTRLNGEYVKSKQSLAKKSNKTASNYTEQMFKTLLASKLRSNMISREDARDLLLDYNTPYRVKAQKLASYDKKISGNGIVRLSSSNDAQQDLISKRSNTLDDKVKFRLVSYVKDEVARGSYREDILANVKNSFEAAIISSSKSDLKTLLKKANKRPDVPSLAVSSEDADYGTTLLDEFNLSNDIVDQSLSSLNPVQKKSSKLDIKLEDNLNLTHLMKS